MNPTLICDQIINEHGFDPAAPGPQIEPFQPWTMRGAMEMVTGHSDLTAWTRSHAQTLRRMLAVGPELVDIPELVITDTAELITIEQEVQHGRQGQLEGEPGQQAHDQRPAQDPAGSQLGEGPAA